MFEFLNMTREFSKKFVRETRSGSSLCYPSKNQGLTQLWFLLLYVSKSRQINTSWIALEISIYVTHMQPQAPAVRWSSCAITDGHSAILRVCMGIFTTALKNWKICQILNKTTSTYFHSVSLVIWPLTLMKRTHFSDLSISRSYTYIRKTSKLRTR